MHLDTSGCDPDAFRYFWTHLNTIRRHVTLVLGNLSNMCEVKKCFYFILFLAQFGAETTVFTTHSETSGLFWTLLDAFGRHLE